MKIPFICVNHNASHETMKYINNVRALNNNMDILIIIVDNSTSNTDFEQLQDFISKNNYQKDEVALLKKENRGYFQGLNEGIQYAKQLCTKNSFYIVGNNDITFKHNFLTELNKISLNENILVLAPDVITKAGSHENPHVIKKVGFLRKLKYDIYFSHFYIGKLLSKIKSTERRMKTYDPVRKEIHMGIGALYVLTPNFFNHFERLSDEVFLFGEEAILTGQVESVKGKILYEPNLVCYHNESFTTNRMEPRLKYSIIRKSYKKYRRYL